VKKPIKKAIAKKPAPAKKAPKGRVAQRTERRTSKAKVVGSIPTPVAKPRFGDVVNVPISELPQRARDAALVAKASSKTKPLPKQPKTQTPASDAPKRGRGRPPTGFDKKAYQRKWMRDKRAADRAMKQSPAAEYVAEKAKRKAKAK
jgi:hypothetical protein